MKTAQLKTVSLKTSQFLNACQNWTVFPCQRKDKEKASLASLGREFQNPGAATKKALSLSPHQTGPVRVAGLRSLSPGMEKLWSSGCCGLQLPSSLITGHADWG